MSKSSQRHKPARNSQFRDSQQPTPTAPGEPIPSATAAVVPASTGRFAQALGKLKHLKGAIVGIAGVGAVLSGFVGWYTTYKTVAEPQANTKTTDAARPVNSKSIAVLPFANMSGDKGQEYFSDGISEELLNQLTKIPDLQVISRNSAFSFKGKDIKTQDIARSLNVANILEGSVRRSGNQLRITAQLIDARTDTHLWSETYERTFDNVFAIQDEIAAAVVGQLKIKLLGAPPKAKVANPEAYALMLQGRQLRRQSTRESLEQAIALLQQANKLDTGYAEAWIELASTYLNLASNLVRPPDKAYPLARDAINKALAINPDLARGHDNLGWIAMTYDADLAKAALHYQRALTLEPGNVLVIANAGALQANLGRLDSAIEWSVWVTKQDPLNAINHSNLGNYYLYAGRFDAAIEANRTALRYSPGYIGAQAAIAQAMLFKGDAQAARAEVVKETDDASRLIALALIEHALGDSKASDAALSELIKKFPIEAAYNIATVYAYRGEAGHAFAWLAKAVAAHVDVTNLPLDPLLAKLKQDPRWLPFMRRIGKAPEQLAAIKFDVKLPAQ